MNSETILKRLEIAKDNQRTKFVEFNECDELYNSVIKQQPGNAQVFNPRAWSAIEMLVPRMMAKKPTVEYLPREDNDQTQSDIIADLFSYWWDKTGGFLKLVEWVKSTAIYGTGIAKVYWCTKTRTVKRHVLDEMGQPLLGEDGNYLIEEEKVTTYDDPDLEIKSIYNVYFNPGATSPDNAKWIIEEYTKPLKDLEKENEETKIYKNLNKLKNLVITKVSPDNQYEKERHESAGNDLEQDDSTVENINLVEMWDMIENKQYILAAGEIVIMERENPAWHGKSPYIKLVDSLVPHEWYGKGELFSIKGLQHALNTVRNQRLDNVTQAVNAMWKVRGDIDETELVWQPNGIIHVNSDLDDAALVEYPNITQNSYEEEKYLTGEMDHALGTADYTQIGDSNSDRTATGMSIKAEQINSRFYHKIQLMEEMALKVLGELVLALYQQYITTERVIRITGQSGNEWQPVGPQDIAGEYDCIVEAGSTQPINKEKDKEESINLLSIFGQDPDLKPEGRYELKVKALEKFGYKKAQEMFISPQEQAEIAQAQEQQAIAQQEEQMMQEQIRAQMEAQNQDMAHQRDMEKLMTKGELDMQREQMKMAPMGM